MPAPPPNTQNGSMTASSTAYVSQTLWSLRKAWFGIGLISCVVNILMLTGPLYMLQVYDRVVASGSISTLMAISILMMMMYIFMGLLDGLRSRILVRIGTSVEKQLSAKTFRLWLKQGLEGPAAPTKDPLGDLANIQRFLTGSAPSTFFDIPWAPIYILVIFMLNWVLGIFAVFGAISVLLIAVWAERSTKRLQSEAQNYKASAQEFTRSCHANAGAVTAMGMAKPLIQHWQGIADQGLVSSMQASDRSGGAGALTKSYRMFLQSAVLGLGAALAVQQIVSPGAMIAGSIILGRALAPIQMVIGQWRSFRSAKNALKRLNEFYAQYDTPDEPMPLPAPTGLIEVRNVAAGPPSAKKATLAGLNFKLEPSDAMCVIGPSAAGKSTLAKLLVGIWAPQRGSVRLDGATFDQWDRNELGKYIGYLPQNIELFDGTIAQNIARFSNAKAHEIVLAAQQADIHDLVLKLPQGYETKIGKGGEILSTGQVQRVALARALFGDPCLVVLDEPNSNLDAMGDKALNQAIIGLRQRGKTVIVITHRQAAMAAVNKVLVLHDGKQVKFGDKEATLKSASSATRTDFRPAPTPVHAPNYSPLQAQFKPQEQFQAQPTAMPQPISYPPQHAAPLQTSAYAPQKNAAPTQQMANMNMAPNTAPYSQPQNSIGTIPNRNLHQLDTQTAPTQPTSFSPYQQLPPQ